MKEISQRGQVMYADAKNTRLPYNRGLPPLSLLYWEVKTKKWTTIVTRQYQYTCIGTLERHKTTVV
jgi:hypothetical protein